MVHEETGPSEANLFSGKFIIDPNEAPSKEVKSIGSLQLLVNPHGQPKKSFSILVITLHCSFVPFLENCTTDKI